MTNQSREAFEDEIASEVHARFKAWAEAGYKAGKVWFWEAGTVENVKTGASPWLYPFLWRMLIESREREQAALSEGRRFGLEAAAYAIENNTCVRHCDLCRTAPCGKTSAEQIRDLIEKAGDAL